MFCLSVNEKLHYHIYFLGAKVEAQFGDKACQNKYFQLSKMRMKNAGHHTCETCGRSYKYRDTLVRHVRLECGKAPQFRCQFCPYMSKQKTNLNVHISLKHSSSYNNQYEIH